MSTKNHFGRVYFLNKPVTMKNFFVFVALLSGTEGFQNYYDNMPNGGSINGDIGHINGDYKTYTPFGLDYKTAGGTWSAYCQKDSDGDGATNGVELGDPNCQWVLNGAAPSGTYQSDPNDPASTPAAGGGTGGGTGGGGGTIGDTSTGATTSSFSNGAIVAGGLAFVSAGAAAYYVSRKPKQQNMAIVQV